MKARVTIDTSRIMGFTHPIHYDSTIKKRELTGSGHIDSLFENHKKSFHRKINGQSTSKFSIHGNLSNQFDYGVIPYYTLGNNYPAHLLKLSGNLKVRFAKLPLLVDYFYSTPKFTTGLNNYFTIRFDVAEYANILNNAKQQQIVSLKNKIDSVANQKQLLYRQIALMEAKKAGMLSMPGLPSIPKLPGTIPDTLITGNVNIALKDSLQGKVPYGDSLANIISQIDTSAATLKRLKGTFEKLSGLETNLKKDLKLLENPASGEDLKGVKGGEKYTGFFSGIKRFEAGLCYPSYSTFMLSQLALKGINFGYAKKSGFINASAGKTVVGYSLQPTSSSIINQVQNLTSLSDWKLNANEKKIAAVQLGLGKEEGSYISIGGLAGKGTNGLTTTESLTNYVAEIKGRYVYKAFGAEAAVSKSYIIDKTATVINNEQPGNNTYTGWNNAYQVKLFGTVPKINTRLQLQRRTIEPFFKSYGMSFTRADVTRTELKADQPLGKKLKLNFSYRLDEDNLKNLYSIKTKLENYTYGAKIKLLRKRMDVALNYSDIYQTITDKTTGTVKGIKSNVKTAVVSYTPRTKKVMTTNTFLFNQYELSDGVNKNKLENFTLSSFNTIKKLRISLSNTYLKNTIKDSLSFSNVINNTLELNYQLSSSLTIGAGGKHALNTDTGKRQYGYSAGLNYGLNKYVSVEFKAEKLVIGDFFNSLNYQKIDNNPYYGYVKVQVSF